MALPLIIAHRGARSLAPENSIAAADVARRMGADLWETDVNVTGDGELILFHDDHLGRTTDVRFRFPGIPDSYLLETFTLKQLRQLDLGTPFLEADPFGTIAAGELTLPMENGAPKWFNGQGAAEQAVIEGVGRVPVKLVGEKIPTLEDALKYTVTHQWPVNLELKQQKQGRLKDFPLPEKVASLIQALKVDPSLIIISSFNHQWLDQMGRLNPQIKRQALVGDDESLLSQKEIMWKTNRFDTYNVNSELITTSEVKQLKEMGKRVNLFTVNDITQMQELIDAGADGIITDFPQRLICLMKSIYPDFKLRGSNVNE